ncbi:MAG: anti-sigma factor domain-containing protein [Saprospiraceae bacterium]
MILNSLQKHSFERPVKMDKEEFLASGLIEQYALGLTSEEETRLVEHFRDNYPDIRAKMNALQEAVEQYAAQYAVSPPRRLKKRILSEIQAEEENSELEEEVNSPPFWKPLPSTPATADNDPTRTARGLLIGLVATMLIAVVFIGILLRQQQQLQADKEMLLGQLANYRTQNTTLEKEQTLFKNIFNFLESGDAYIIHLWGKGVSKDAHAVVYWNPNTRKSYIRLLKMPALPTGKQFQLWADVDTTMVNAGLLESHTEKLQTVQFIESADSLNITMEPLGGSPEPSVYLQVAQGPLK